jgi:hypothetical protein
MAQLRKVWDRRGAHAGEWAPTGGPDPGPGLAGTPGARTGPVWGQRCPQNVNRKSTIEQFPAETPYCRGGRDCVTDCVLLAVPPQPTKWKHIGKCEAKQYAGQWLAESSLIWV